MEMKAGDSLYFDSRHAHQARVDMLKNIPLDRFGLPEEIVKVVLFLCCDLSSYFNGQVVNVNRVGFNENFAGQALFWR